MAALLLATALSVSAGSAQDTPAEVNRPADQPDADGRIIRGRENSKYWLDYMKSADLSDYRHASPESYEAFKDLKYGLRIHWGIYAFVHGKESWVLPQRFNNEPQAEAWYRELPRAWYPSAFDPESWMDMAKRVGFTFFTFTTKHHDGFSLYETKTKVTRRRTLLGSDPLALEPRDEHYSIMETPFGRDVTREVVEAGRARGLKVGLYFSNPDWYDADFRFRRPGADRNYTPQSDPEGFARFAERHSAQISELLTNYGKIDMLSLDLAMTHSVWPQMQRAARQARAIQPDVMIRWRGIGNYGDYQTPENVIPGEDEMGTMPWKVIHTLSKREIFSYEPDENNYHDGRWILDNLVDVVAKGGNFEVGIGPDLTGVFHPKAIEALDYAGEWLRVNGEAIFATRPRGGFREGEHVWFTRSKDQRTIYVLHRGWPEGGRMVLASIEGRDIQSARLLGSDLPVRTSARRGGGGVITVDRRAVAGADRPDRHFYVVRLTLSEPDGQAQ